LALDRDGTRIARVLRRTYDMLLNGKDTGRYRWDQLHKTENLNPESGLAGQNGAVSPHHTAATR
jgi:hypothetical protein